MGDIKRLDNDYSLKVLSLAIMEKATTAYNEKEEKINCLKSFQSFLPSQPLLHIFYTDDKIKLKQLKPPQNRIRWHY